MTRTLKVVGQGLALGLVLLSTAGKSQAQFGGNSAGFGNAGGGAIYRDRTDNVETSPTLSERNKRQSNSSGESGSVYLDAGVLMNVKADEYVAVFAVNVEGTTPLENDTKINGMIAQFRKGLQGLGIKDKDVFVDFVSQTRIYRSILDQEKMAAQEELVGFELKKNVSVHFTDKNLLDAMVTVAARAQIYDVVKVDYVVRDAQAIKDRVRAEVLRILKNKAAQYDTQLGLKLYGPLQIMVDSPSVYYPVEQYRSYVAAEAETVVLPPDKYTVKKLRRSRTFYFDPLNGSTFDTVINPVIVEPVVQFTAYIRARYGNIGAILR